MDNRRYNRLAFRGLDHEPTPDEVLAFLSEFNGPLARRGLSVRGVTTDGSSLYPKVLKQLWLQARHQGGRFHVRTEITEALRHARARFRKERTAKIPKPPRGRPRHERQGQAGRIASRKRGVAERLEPCYRFVRHPRREAPRPPLRKLSSAHPALRTLRQSREAGYRLFDRRCRTQTAWKKLLRLRRRVRRFQKLGQSRTQLTSPHREKALLFLDAKLLGGSSNAVARANRRFRQAPQSRSGVRTKEHQEQRLALDRYREQRAAQRGGSLKTLHETRSRGGSGHP